MSKCVVCQNEERVGLALCATCERSYDRLVRKDDATLVSIMTWAANRARRLERAKDNPANRLRRIESEYPNCPCCGWGMPGPHSMGCPLHRWRAK